VQRGFVAQEISGTATRANQRWGTCLTAAPALECAARTSVANPQLEKYRGRLVTVRVPGLRGKRTGWVIDSDDEEYDWRDDLGDAEEQVESGDLVPIVYLGEIEDGELVEAEGFLLFEPDSQDLYLVDEGSLEDESVGTLDELVVTPLAVEDEETEDEDEDFVDDEAVGEEGGAGGGDGESEEEEYKEDDADDED
jgi:hypothetical protein